MAFGGKPEFAARVTDPTSYQKWLDSIDGNEVWVDYYPNSLFLLSDFVPAEMKIAMNEAIDAHLSEAAIVLTPTLINGVLSLPSRRLHTKATNEGKGDNDINSKNNRKTEWELQTELSLLDYDSEAEEYRTLVADFVYIVREGQSDWTILQMEHEERYNISGLGVIDLQRYRNSQSGLILGQSHDFNEIPQVDSFFSELKVKIDGKGNDNNNLALMAAFAIPDIEKAKQTPEETL